MRDGSRLRVWRPSRTQMEEAFSGSSCREPGRLVADREPGLVVRSARGGAVQEHLHRTEVGGAVATPGLRVAIASEERLCGHQVHAVLAALEVLCTPQGIERVAIPSFRVVDP